MGGGHEVGHALQLTAHGGIYGAVEGLFLAVLSPPPLHGGVLLVHYAQHFQVDVQAGHLGDKAHFVALLVVGGPLLLDELAHGVAGGLRFLGQLLAHGQVFQIVSPFALLPFGQFHILRLGAEGVYLRHGAGRLQGDDAVLEFAVVVERGAGDDKLCVSVQVVVDLVQA